MKSLVTFSIIVILFVTFFLLFGYLSSNTTLGMSAEDERFSTKIAERIRLPGDSLLVSEAHVGDWIQVCSVPPYAVASEVVAKALGSALSDLVYDKSKDKIASDNLWGMAFIYSGNRFEYLQISSKYFYSDGKSKCLDKSNAILHVNDFSGGGTYHLSLAEHK